LGKIGSQESEAVLHSLYVQLLSINFVSCVNWKVQQIVKLSPLIGPN